MPRKFPGHFFLQLCKRCLNNERNLKMSGDLICIFTNEKASPEEGGLVIIY